MALKLALAGAGLLLGAAQTFVQINAAKKAERLRVEAANAEEQMARNTAKRNYDEQTLEFNRQAEIIDRQAKDAKSDIARKSRSEMAALRVAFGETGATETNNALSILDNESYLFGVDISRIEANRRESLDAIQSDKRAAAQDMANTVNAATLNANINRAEARLEAQNARTSAFLNFLGTGLNIANRAYSQQTSIQMAQGYQPTYIGSKIPVPTPAPRY